MYRSAAAAYSGLPVSRLSRYAATIIGWSQYSELPRGAPILRYTRRGVCSNSGCRPVRVSITAIHIPVCFGP